MGKIPSAHVLISRSCVNDCIFCAVASKREKKQFPSYNDIVRFIKKSHSYGVSHLIFSGLGEPTLDVHFEQYLAIANNLGFKTLCLFTNGFKTDIEKAQRWKQLGLNKVLLSIHGIKTGHDNNVQRANAFEEAINALNVYRDLSYDITVNTCLTIYNLDEIPQLRQVLSKYPISIHTLSFPEWSGNAIKYSHCLPSYSKIGELSFKLIPSNDNRTVFDNIPYCIVGRNIREMSGIKPALYLDGKEEGTFTSNQHKVFPGICYRTSCPYLSICPGFERNYIRTRGWENLDSIVQQFLATSTVVEKNIGNWNGISLKRNESGLKVADTRAGKKSLSVIIKPTSRCNGDCVYCSSYREKQTPDMKSSDFKKLCDLLFEFKISQKISRLNFLWHGGEPLMMGKVFFDNIWNHLKDTHNYINMHMLQSNLLLLDKDWIELFKAFDVHISTSVDPVVDTIRIYPKGRPQFPDWIDKFSMLCDENIPLGIVFTATRLHLGYEQEIYNFFKNLQTISRKRISTKINPVYASGKAIHKTESAIQITPHEYGHFLFALWKLWVKDNKPFPLSPFYDFQNGNSRLCEFSGTCQESFLAVDYGGNVYNCGRFCDAKTAYGNLFNDTLPTILNHPDRLLLKTRTLSLSTGACHDCQYWDYCHGGCPYFAHLYSGDINQKSPFCESYKYLFDKTEGKVFHANIAC